MKRYGKSPAGRIGAAAMLRTFAVLVRRHPKAALDMAGAGLAEAGRSGLAEVKRAILPSTSQAMNDDESSCDKASATVEAAEPEARDPNQRVPVDR